MPLASGRHGCFGDGTLRAGLDRDEIPQSHIRVVRGLPHDKLVEATAERLTRLGGRTPASETAQNEPIAGHEPFRLDRDVPRKERVQGQDLEKRRQETHPVATDERQQDVTVHGRSDEGEGVEDDGGLAPFPPAPRQKTAKIDAREVEAGG